MPTLRIQTTFINMGFLLGILIENLEISSLSVKFAVPFPLMFCPDPNFMSQSLMSGQAIFGHHKLKLDM